MHASLPLILSLLLLLLLILGGYALWLALGMHREQRLQQQLARLQTSPPQGVENLSIIKAGAAPHVQRPWWQRLPGHAWLLRALQHAGHARQPGHFWAGTIVAGIIGVIGASLRQWTILLAAMAAAAVSHTLRTTTANGTRSDRTGHACRSFSKQQF